MTLTVKELADMAGISRRTLHYYDEIGLLRPSAYGDNGYRYYQQADALRLQQILFYRELDFPLERIQRLLDQPDFDRIQALRSHRQALQKRILRLQSLIGTVDRTIEHLKGQTPMGTDEIFGGFSEEQLREWEREATELYGEDEVAPTYARWNSYSVAKKQQVLDEGNAIYSDLVGALGHEPESPEVQAIIRRWHQHLRYFYEPSVERLRGLGEMYVSNPDFAERFRKMHPDLPEFLREAIQHYTQGIEPGDSA